ncbi:MAG TPA: hypothetical protein VF666_00675 [Pyrinomonadaceae bacterium]
MLRMNKGGLKVKRRISGMNRFALSALMVSATTLAVMASFSLTTQDVAAAVNPSAATNLSATINAARSSATGTSTVTVAANEADVRRAMERAFQMLRAGEFGGLYNALPSASQRRISRARFVSGMNRARGMYELDRLEINSVRVAGDLAVVDAVLYGRARQPIEGEGKIVARQYMVREGGQWRVTTGERSTIAPLLAANPQFARRFPATEPRVYLKRDGKWVDISAFAASMRRRQTK